MLHVYICSYHVTPISFNWHSFFALFSLPLFFFMSGFLFFKKERPWTIRTCVETVISKTKVLIIPTLVFFYLYTRIFNVDFYENVATDMKSGYWFTIALFWFFIIYTMVMTVFRGGWGGIIFLFLLSVLLLWSNSQICYELIHPNYVGIAKLRYFIFFLLGTFVKEYFDVFERLIEGRWTMTILIPLFALSTIFFFNKDISETLRFAIWGSIGLIIVFCFFRHFGESFSEEKIFGFSLQYLGRRTLDIYLLHYFFLPRNLEVIGYFFSENYNPTLEVFLSLLFALLVIALCVITSNIIRLSPLLANWLLGVKIVKQKQ